MDTPNIFKDVIQPVVISVGSVIALSGFVFALVQYRHQQRFKRLQNLSSLWKRFSDGEDLLGFFILMNDVESENTSRLEELKNFDPKTKLKYLALIEEVALYVSAFEVDEEYAKYLFQWHFAFPYQSKLTSIPFWANIGGTEEQNASYWKKSRDLSSKFRP